MAEDFTSDKSAYNNFQRKIKSDKGNYCLKLFLAALLVFQTSIKSQVDNKFPTRKLKNYEIFSDSWSGRQLRDYVTRNSLSV